MFISAFSPIKNLLTIKDQGQEELITENIYPTKNFNSLAAAIRLFLKENDITKISNSACFSVAGPVKNGAGWVFTESEVQAELGIKKVVLLNDFAACGFGIKMLREKDLFEISSHRHVEEKGPKVIIGAGLGEANMFNTDSGEFIVVPGEGGHADFAPRNKIECDLLHFIKSHLKIDRVSVERVVSGPGLLTVYTFFAHQNPELENQKVTEELINAKSPGQIISSLAIAKKDLLCKKTLKLFISVYGAESDNLALKVFPSGRVYVAGGFAPQVKN